MGNKKKLLAGLAMLCGFVIVLILFFAPVLSGKNGLDYLDSLYNSISKASAYYIPKVREEAVDPMKGKQVSVTLATADPQQAEKTAELYDRAGAGGRILENRIRVDGDLGKILRACLADADAMFFNKGGQVSRKYGYPEKEVLVQWWKSLREMEKALKHQERYKEAAAVAMVVKKAVETSYNYYGIEPQKITDRAGIVIFSLLFYVAYTVWYGFAFMFVFEGCGMKLEH